MPRDQAVLRFTVRSVCTDFQVMLRRALIAATRRAPFSQQICRSCKVPTVLVEDHAAGELTCKARPTQQCSCFSCGHIFLPWQRTLTARVSLAQECAQVLESHTIVETSEWRSFVDSDKANQSNPNRVGGPSNPLLNSGGLGTSVAKGSDAQSHACVTRAVSASSRRAPWRFEPDVTCLLPPRSLARQHARGPDPDRCVLRADGGRECAPRCALSQH